MCSTRITERKQETKMRSTKPLARRKSESLKALHPRESPCHVRSVISQVDHAGDVCLEQAKEDFEGERREVYTVCGG